MVAFNFQAQFAPEIRAGRKTQTIRRNERCKAGDTLQLYTGQRTKQCALIGTATCAICEPIRIAEDHIASGGWRLPSGDAHHIATIDGFASVDAMRDWFRNRYGLPFSGYRVMWHGFTPSTSTDTHTDSEGREGVMDLEALLDGFLEIDRALERMAKLSHVDESKLPSRAAYRLGLLQQSIRLARRAVNEADNAVGRMVSEDFNSVSTHTDKSEGDNA